LRALFFFAEKPILKGKGKVISFFSLLFYFILSMRMNDKPQLQKKQNGKCVNLKNKKAKGLEQCSFGTIKKACM